MGLGSLVVMCFVEEETRFLVCHATLSDYVRKVTYDVRWETVTLSQQSAKFLGNGSCGRGDGTFLICHVASCDHVIKGHMTLLVAAPSPLLTTVPSLVIIDLLKKGGETFLICYATIHYHGIKGTWCDLVSGSPSP